MRAWWCVLVGESGAQAASTRRADDGWPGRMGEGKGVSLSGL